MTQENSEFSKQQRQAMERMLEMQQRSQIINNEPHPMPPVPPFVKLSKDSENHYGTTYRRETQPAENLKTSLHGKSDSPLRGNTVNSANRTQGIFLPFLNGSKPDKDLTLILGLILILANEKADRKLLLALLYILM